LVWSIVKALTLVESWKLNIPLSSTYYRLNIFYYRNFVLQEASDGESVVPLTMSICLTSVSGITISVLSSHYQCNFFFAFLWESISSVSFPFSGHWTE
jgi:hypothetical protein